jgi:hypothetical protein
MGDVVAANKTFMDIHLQNRGYLSSRECELAEELIRAVKSFDSEALQKLKSSRVLANVDPYIRELVQTLKISGKARSKVIIDKVVSAASTRVAEIGGAISSTILPVATNKALTTAKPDSAPERYEHGNLDGEELQKSITANFNEMEDLMGKFGLDESDDNGEDVDGSNDGDDDEDIDLR